MQKPYSIEKIRYLCHFAELKYTKLAEMLGYAPSSIYSLMYQVDKGKNISENKKYRVRLLLTYTISDYILEKYGDLEYMRMLKATDHHIETRAREKSNANQTV